MDASTLSGLTRVQLQKVAKLHGIKANRKTELIIEDLLDKYPSGVPKTSRKPKRAAPLSAPIHPPSPSGSQTAHLADPHPLPIELPHASTSSVMIPPPSSAAPPPPTIPRTPVQPVRLSSPPRTSPQTRTNRKQAHRSTVAQGSPIRAPHYASASAASTSHRLSNAGQRSVGFVSPQPSPESPHVMRGSSRAHTPVPLNFEQSLEGEGEAENPRVSGENAGPAPSTPRMAESPFLGSAQRRKRDLYRSPTPAPTSFRKSLDNRAEDADKERDSDQGSQSSRGYTPNSPPYRPASSGHQSSRGYTPNSPPYCPVSPILPPRVYSPSSVDSFLRSLDLPHSPLPLPPSAPSAHLSLAPPQPLLPVGGTKTSAGSASQKFVDVATLRHLTGMMQEMADSNQAAVDHLPRVMQEAACLMVEVERYRELLLIARRQRLDLQEWLTKFINDCGEGEMDQEVMGDGRREVRREDAGATCEIPHPSDQAPSANQRGTEERVAGEGAVHAAQSDSNGAGRPSSDVFGSRGTEAALLPKSPNGSDRDTREVFGGARAAHPFPVDRATAIFGDDEEEEADQDFAAPSQRAPVVGEDGEVPDREDWDPSRRALFFGEYDDEPDRYEDRHSSVDPEEIPEVSTLPTQTPALASPPHSVRAPSHSPLNITFGYYPGSTDNFPLSPPLRRVSSSEREYTPPNFPSMHFGSSFSGSLRDVPQLSPAGVKRKRLAAPSPPSEAGATIAEEEGDEDGFSEHCTSSPVVDFNFNGKRRKLDSTRSGDAGSHRGTASPEVKVKVEHSDDELDRSNVAEMLSFDHDHRIDGYSSDSSRSDTDHDVRRRDWPLPPEAMFFSKLPR